jgi:hypothetical protein
MRRTTLYVAESDEQGHIEWVWVMRSGQRAPKPFDPRSDMIKTDLTVDCAGAGRMAILSWLAASVHGNRNVAIQARRVPESPHNEDGVTLR